MDFMYNYEGNLGKIMEGLILYLRVGTNPCIYPFWSRLFLGGDIWPPIIGITGRRDLASMDLILCSFVVKFLESVIPFTSHGSLF